MDQIKLSHEAKTRLKWMEHYKKYRNVRLTCRHFGISPDTFYRWKKRYELDNSNSLEDTISRRPKKVRRPRLNSKAVTLIKRIKENQPGIGKIKIGRIIREHGIILSGSTISRIMRFLSKFTS